MEKMLITDKNKAVAYQNKKYWTHHRGVISKMMCPFFICDFVETDRAPRGRSFRFHDTGTFAFPYLISTDILLRSAAKLVSEGTVEASH